VIRREIHANDVTMQLNSLIDIIIVSIVLIRTEVLSLNIVLANVLLRQQLRCRAWHSLDGNLMWRESPRAFREYQKLFSLEVAASHVVTAGITVGTVVVGIMLERRRRVMDVRRNAVCPTCDHYCSYRTCSRIGKLVDQPLRFICLCSLQHVIIIIIIIIIIVIIYSKCSYAETH